MSLAASQLVLARGGRDILSDLSLEIAPGTVTALLGANGAGKSTLLGALAGELAPRAGRLSLDGVDLRDLGVRRQARLRAVLPQKPGLGFDLPVSEVVAMGAYPFPELAPAEVDALVVQALALAGMAEHATRRYLALSGGEQQRVQFARVLAQCRAGRRAGQTRYLLLDEPISNLDPRHQGELLQVATRLAHDEGVGVLVILHDINLAARWCDRLVMLAHGRLLAAGQPAEVLTPALLREVYDVDADVIDHPTLPGRRLVLMR